jgi:uncharacterized membrane protein YidH (DUF202 family)
LLKTIFGKSKQELKPKLAVTLSQFGFFWQQIPTKKKRRKKMKKNVWTTMAAILLIVYALINFGAGMGQFSKAKEEYHRGLLEMGNTALIHIRKHLLDSV